jgi:hypothetical protein
LERGVYKVSISTKAAGTYWRHKIRHSEQLPSGWIRAALI